MLLQLLDTKFVGCYQPLRSAQGWMLEYGNGQLRNGLTSEVSNEVRSQLSAVLQAGPRHMRLAHVPATEQNRVISMRERLTLDEWESMPITQRVIPALGFDTHCFDLRVLFAERGLMRGWCGAYQEAPFSACQKAQFQRLVPRLKEQVNLERYVGRVNLLELAFATALGAIAQPAYLVDAAARIVTANAPARRRFDRAKSGVQSALAEWVRTAASLSARGNSLDLSQATVTALRVDGMPLHYLIIERPSEVALEHRVARAAERWGLTSRQVEILERLALGDANKDIALRLACSLRTVEHHMSQIFAKSGQESRSGVISSLLA
jgi:DNA-binding CsgD family transcriptional regulator